ncbi:MAG: glycoside hydrolase family 13 protein [Bacteroidota bacterium]
MRFSLFSWLLLALTSLTAQTLQHVEPPNWWVGMQHSTVQVMIHGAGAAEWQAGVDYSGVALRETSRLQSDNYLFLTLSIDATTEPGEVPIVFSKNGEIVLTHRYPLHARTAGRANLQGFDATDAIYLITPDRFANGDMTNDEMSTLKEGIDRKNPGGRHGGDIAGIRQHLDYIEDLGFTAIWLNPLLENDMETYSYHGYSTTDFYRVDPRFGSNEDYRQLAESARAKDMGLIMDMIVNHCGLNHWWMNDLPSTDWVNQWPSYTETNHRKTVIQDPYASEIDRKVFTDGWFVPTMPDLNQRNPYLATYLTQNAIWWIEYLGLTGIRMDTYPYPDMEYMAAWTEAVMTEYPDFNVVGEEWYSEPAIVAYWQRDKENPNGYTSDLRSLMDFPLQIAVTDAFVNEESFGEGLVEAYEALAHDFLYADPMELVIFPDNHDMSRIFTQVNEDYDWFKQVLLYYATMRGVPQFYYGTEILMGNPGTTAHGVIRSDFPGGWPGDRRNGFTNEKLSDQQLAAKAYTKKLLQWRKTATAVHNGQLLHFAPEEGVYVYFRYNDAQKIMVVLNKNEEVTELKLDRFREILAGHTSAQDVLSAGKTWSLDAPITLAPRTGLLLTVE